ncbi:CGNR zinc finger domain-containing protein [Spirillospora sp. CA-108201]
MEQDVLLGAQRELIRQSAAPERTRLLLDRSRGGACRWCDTACGNKIKPLPIGGADAPTSPTPRTDRPQRAPTRAARSSATVSGNGQVS